jgi:myo-inositol-1(or 4)-monophosphatase
MLSSDSLGQLSPSTINQIITWARQAGQIALRYFKNIEPQRKPDQSFLTQADLEIERFLAERFQTVFPDHDLIGEEKLRVENSQLSPNLWAIDPLDGTTAFVQGLPGWGISIGLLRRGQPNFGLFYMPLLDDITYTVGPNGVYRNERDLRKAVRPDWGSKGFLAVSASAHRDFQLNVHRIQTMGSVGANLVYTARGAAAGAFIPKARLWDMVAGAAILARAGGELRYLSGKSIDYLQLLDGRLAPEPVIAGSPRILAELQRAIRPR